MTVLPGTRLKKWFGRLGFAICCRCERLAATMDREGVEWCVAHDDWIADRIMVTARKRGYGSAYRPIVVAAIYFACRVPLMEIPSSTLPRNEDRVSVRH